MHKNLFSSRFIILFVLGLMSYTLNADAGGDDGFATRADPPQAPDSMAAIKSGDDLYLQWSSVTQDTSGGAIIVEYYVIYRDTTYTLTSETADSITAVAAPSTSYTDFSVVGEIETDYFYVVQARDSSGQKSVDSEKVGETAVNIIAGWNSMSWPFVVYDTNIQAVFADSMGLGCQLTGGYPATNSDQVKYYDAATAAWYTAWYKVGGPGLSDVWRGTLTTIEPDKAYWIFIQNATRQGNIFAAGEINSVTRVIPIQPPVSYNLVGYCRIWPTQLSGSTGDDANLLGSGFRGGWPLYCSDKILTFNNDTGYWETAHYKLHGPGQNNIWMGQITQFEPGKAYWIVVVDSCKNQPPQHGFFNNEWILP